MDDMRNRFRTGRRESDESKPQIPIVHIPRRPLATRQPAKPLRPVYERPSARPAAPAPQLPQQIEVESAPVPVDALGVPAEIPAEFADPIEPVAPITPATTTADETEASPELTWLLKPAQEAESQLILEHEPGFIAQLLAIAKREVPKQVWLIGGVIAGLILLTIGTRAVFYHSSHAVAKVELPAEVIKSLSFDAYYPRQVPNGFTYLNGSAVNLAGNLQFRLVNGNAMITVTEYPTPATATGKLGALPGSAVFSLIQGQARVNLDAYGTPEGVLVTRNVRINVAGNGDATTPEVTSVIENLWRN